MKINLKKVGVVWYSRGAKSSACTGSFLIFLERLKYLDTRLGVWYEQGTTHEEARKNEVPFQYDFIRNKFCDTCDDTDFPEFAFDIHLWNGAEISSRSSGLSASLGSSQERLWNNNCILVLPSEGEVHEDYANPENFERLKKLFVNHWNPELVMCEDNKWAPIMKKL